MFGEKGQAFAAMKFLQGAAIAVVLLGIIYGALQMVKQYEPGDDPLTVSGKLLASAYSAVGTGISFSGKIRLVSMFLTGNGIKQKAGIDNPSLNVKICCDQPIAKASNGKCTAKNCFSRVQVLSGNTALVCVVCPSADLCYVHLGTNKC